MDKHGNILFFLAPKRLIATMFMVLLTVAVFSRIANGEPTLAYIDIGAGGRSCCMVSDRIGNVFVVSSTATATGSNVLISKLDETNHIIWNFRFGGSRSDQPNATTLDLEGNLIVVGQSTSPDFPLLHPLVAETEPSAQFGFITKVNPTSGQILFSTRVGGLSAEPSVKVGSSVTAVTLDAAGNIFAGGITNAKDFP